MTTYIQHIETLVPDHVYPQDYARDRMIGWIGDPTTARFVRRLYDRSGIARRHCVLGDFTGAVPAELFRTDAAGRLSDPSTEERNRCYIQHARRLAGEVARRALEATPELAADDITHVVTASCTGFYNPGPDLDIVFKLGLPETVERYHLGFMGCYAAFPALRMADQFCRANPDAVVLVVCLELCSLHLQVRNDPDSLLANVLFADGAAAAIVSARPPVGSRPALGLGSFRSALATDGGGDMAWEIGNRGFNIVLSSYVPDIIAGNLGPIVENILVRAGLDRGGIDRWAIHPGGKAILDKIERGLALEPGQVAAARAVLRDYGNMSSATILFVLKRILETLTPGVTEQLCAMAFGPGLTIETAILETVPATVPAEPALAVAGG